MSSKAYLTPGTFTWTWPAGVTSVVVECLGGGGGGGIAQGNPSTGGGGKGGSYSRATITKGAESTLSIVVGAGGAIAAAGAASTVTQVATVVCAGPGGAGGATQATSSANGAGATTANGTAVGTTQFAGGNGGTGNFTSGVGGSGAGGGAAGPTSAGGAASGNTAGTAGTGLWADQILHAEPGMAGVGNSTAGISGGTESGSTGQASSFGGGASGGKANANTDQNGGTGGSGFVLLSWTSAATTLQRVQASGKWHVTGAAGAMTMGLPAQLTVGNAALVLVAGFRSGGMTLGNLVNAGTSTFTKLFEARLTASANFAFGIYLCQVVTQATNAIALQGVASDRLVACAIEFSGLGSNALSLTTSANVMNGSSTTPSSGATAAVAGEAIVVGMLLRDTAVASITEALLEPTWVEECEELTLTYVPCEFDTRIVNLAGAAATASWTLATTGNWGAYVAVLQLPVDQAVAGATIAAGSAVTAPIYVTFAPTARVNVALAANGGTAQASSYYSSPAANFAPANANNGDRSGAVWGTNGGWCDGTVSAFPDWLEIDFAGLVRQTINEIDIFSMQDAYNAPVDPTLGLTFTLYGLVDFEVQYWNPVLGWQPVPGGTITGNNLVWRKLTFPQLTTIAIRVMVSAVAGANDYSRIVEIEAYTAAPPGADQTIAGATIAAGSAATAPPFVALPGPDQAVTGATRASTASITAPTVAVATTATLLSDTFTDADGTALAAHTMDVGPGWAVVQGVIQILSNRGSGANGASGVVSAAIAEAGVADGVVSAQFTLPPSLSGNYSCGIVVRATSWDDCWAAVLENDNLGTAGSDFIGIYERTAGVQTQRAGGPSAGLIASVGGTTVTLTVTLAGDTITLTGGSGSCTYSSTVHNTATHHGFYLFFITGNYLNIPVDNFNTTGASSSGPTTISGATLSSAVQLFAPTVAGGGGVDQAVSGTTRATAAALFAPTVAPGPVTITNAAIGSGAQLFAPTITVGAVTVVGATRATAAQLFASTVAPGPVTLLGVTLTSAAQLFVPSVTSVAAGSIGAATITSGATVFPPSVVGGLAIILAQTVAATSTVFVPSVAPGAVTILGATRATSSTLFAPTIAPGPVTILAGTAIATTVQLFPPTLGGGAVTILGATITSTAQPFAPTLAVGAVTLIGATIATSAQLFAPTIIASAAVTGSTISSAAIARAPSTITVGPVTLLGVTIASTAVLVPPTVTALALGAIGAANIPTTAQLFPPTIVGGLAIILAPTIAPSAQLFAPALTVGPVTISGATIPSSLQLFAPALLPGAVTILAATRSTTAQLYPPSLTVGPAIVVTATRPSTAQLFVPTVVRVAVPTIGVPFLASTAVLHAPLVHPPVSFPLFITGGTITTLAQLYPPSVAARPPRVTACDGSSAFVIDPVLASDWWRVFNRRAGEA